MTAISRPSTPSLARHGDRGASNAKGAEDCPLSRLFLCLLGLVVLLSGCFRETEVRVATYDLVAAAKWAPALPHGVTIADDSLVLSAGSRLDLYQLLPVGAALSLEGVALRDTTAASLTVEIEWAGEQPVTVAKLGGGRAATTLLPGRGGIGRLGFEVQCEDGEGRVVLRRPRIVYPVSGNKIVAVEPVEDEPVRPPNLIVYLVDTLRADHLGAYGYDGSLTPRFDAFAASATVFEDGVAQSPWTRASVASIFTGLEPNLHGVNDRDDSLSDQAVTLAELLGAHGYHSAAFITNGNAGQQFGLAQGFDVFWQPKGNYQSDIAVLEKAVSYLRSSPPQPFFLWIHVLDPHHPYTPPESHRVGRGAPDPKLGQLDVLKALKAERHGQRLTAEVDDVTREIEALYDAEVALADEAFGYLVDQLQELDLFENSVIIVTADHGEEFWEHGDWSHGQTLYREVMHVPLIVREPRQREARRREDLAQHIDILPTLLDYAGKSVPAGVSGRSLRSVKISAEPYAYSVLDLDGRRGFSITTPEWKLFVPINRNGREMRHLLFDRRSDRDELEDVSASHGVMVGYLRTLARRHEARAPAVEAEKVELTDPELIKQLRALGYIE